MSKFNLVEFWLHETMVPGPWSQLTEKERKMLTALAKDWLSFETLDERGHDRLDFQEVSVWSVRVALARAYLAGAQRMPP